jgi:hypothetical protein
MEIWPAAASRPDDFPAGLPFVPDVEVGVEHDAVAGVVVMKWWGVARPLELMQQLLGASVKDGWTLYDDAPQPTGDAGSVRRMCFRLRERERIIEAMQAAQFSFVTLTERPAG